VVLSLSGGLDSNAVASTITELRRAGRTAVETSALTTVWRKDIEDDEERYAALAAAAYQIPLELHAADGCEAFAGWDDLRVRGLEPTDEPCSAAFYGFVAAAARHARVILTGEGGDPLLYNSHEHFFRLLTRLRLDRFLFEAGGYLLRRRKRPPLNLRSQLLRALGRPPRGRPAYPSWIASDLERRAQLRDRWQEVLVPTARLHPYRNEAARMLDSASWARAFEVTDPGASGQLVEWRSPYFDVRLVEFLFSLPPMPHFAEKDLVRESLRGRMPEDIRRRPKRALSRDPSALAFERQRERWIREVDTAAEVASYVDRRILTKNLREASHNDYRSSQQAFAVGLSIWLTRRNR
ncbi:MAG TPA: asparagine synthase C-terminal domain-containing protein, partial [Thermoanaerobaculia bacterium]|nr:asparagine synthase C-terminal domain-containing protein [Thermoanaerobaculia bacterium]